MRLVVVFSRGMSLRGWQAAGILERELALYRELGKRGVRVEFLTYGADEPAIEGVGVLANRWRLPSNLYSLMAPLLHRAALRGATIVKANQLNGAWTAVLARRVAGARLLVRAGFVWSVNLARETPSVWRRVLADRLEGWACRAADRVVVAADAQRRYLAERHAVPAARIDVIPNYVDLDIFRPRPEIKRQRGLVAFVGRLAPEKNVEPLLEAVAGIPDTRLVVMGDGPLRGDLESRARALGAAVEFPGARPPAEVAELLAAAEAFVLPSRYEGHPKALLEAMASGVPVVGADVPGIREVIRQGNTGLLCEPSVDGIRAALAALRGDRETAQRMAARARVYVERECSLASAVEREMTVLETLARG
jgi:glycosyltransferase involved in cell wall biosynthesis